MSRSSRRKHINKLKKAKNERKAIAKLQGTAKMTSKGINLAQGLVEVSERSNLWKESEEEVGNSESRMEVDVEVKSKKPKSAAKKKATGFPAIKVDQKIKKLQNKTKVKRGRIVKKKK